MPLRSLKDVDRHGFSDMTGRELRRYEGVLNPFILTDCCTAVPAWSALAANTRAYLNDYAPFLTTTEAEVAAMKAEDENTVSLRPGRDRSGSAIADSVEPGCREAPRYYGGHHDIRLHREQKAGRQSRTPVAGAGSEVADSPALRAVLGAPPSTSKSSHGGAGRSTRHTPQATVLDPDQANGDALAALDASEPQLTDMASPHRATYRWTGGIDILDDPQQVQRGLLEQRVQQLASTTTAASPGASRPLISEASTGSASRQSASAHSRTRGPRQPVVRTSDENNDAGENDSHNERCMPSDGDDDDDNDSDDLNGLLDAAATFNSGNDDDVNVNTAAPRLPDRRPEFTLGEALRVIDKRHPHLVTSAAIAANLAAPPVKSSPLTASSWSEASAQAEPHFAYTDGLTVPERIASELSCTSAALYVKSRLSGCPELCESLGLDKLLFTSVASPSSGESGSTTTVPSFAASTTTKVAIKASALGLQGPSYAAWLCVGEKGAGTRSHANVSGSHGWHLLLRGTKKWRIAHPLDRHLLASPLTGALSDLFQDSALPREAQQHARVFEVTQHAGEALFLPSEAVYCDLCLDNTVAVHVNFYDATTIWQERRFKRLYTLLLAPTNRDAMFPTLVPMTTVDLVLFADNVYPSFRGKNRAYRPDTAQDLVVVRGFAEFTQVRLPCSELGARVELEAMQHCFSAVGKFMLDRFTPARYAVGVPKGYIACEKEHRLLLFYYVKPYSLDQIKEALTHPEVRKATEGGRRPMQFFTRDQVTLPDIDYFRSTCSHQGLLPNYVPLSVLFGQSWPFEKDLCRYLVSLPRIILDKAYNQRGFIRPGSVWHYSRFDLDNPADHTPHGNGTPTPKVPQGSEAGVHASPSRGGTHATLLHPARRSSGSVKTLADMDGTATGPVTGPPSTPGSSIGKESPSPAPKEMPGSAPAGTEAEAAASEEDTCSTIPASFAHSFVNVEAVEHQPGAGWCRTFLFYCSSLLDTPVEMHPIETSPALQDSQSLLSNGIRSLFHPRILEFAWNVNMLEEYGLVSLLQLETAHETAEAVIRRKILRAPCFPQFEDFLELHAMHRIQHDRENNVEKVMAAVLWFTCTPCIVGFVSGTSTGATRQGSTGRVADSTIQSETENDESTGTPSAGATMAGSSFGANPQAPGLGYVSFLDSDPEEPRGKWDTVCLTATAASVLLECVSASPYGVIVSRLSNWLCDEYEEASEARQVQVLQLALDAVNSHDVERQAVVFEVLRIKRQTYERQCRDRARNKGAAANPQCGDHNCNLVNRDKLVMVEKMFADFKLPPTPLPCLPPSL